MGKSGFWTNTKEKGPAEMERTAAVATMLIDNDRVRVTRFDFTPGAETTWHRHDHDYVITAITDLNMRLEEPGNTEREVTVTAGEAYFRNVGVEHNVINVGSEPMSFVEVELK